MGGDGQTRTAVDGRKSEATTTRWFLSEFIVWDDDDEEPLRVGTGAVGSESYRVIDVTLLRGRNRNGGNQLLAGIDRLGNYRERSLGKGRD